MNFSTKVHDIFRRWYVDGRYTIIKLLIENHLLKEYTELRYIDPRKIKKIREIKRTTDVLLLQIYRLSTTITNTFYTMKKVLQTYGKWY